MLVNCVHFYLMISSQSTKCSIYIGANTCKYYEASMSYRAWYSMCAEMAWCLKLGACIYFYVLISSRNTHVFMLYSCNKPYMLRSVQHIAFGQLWSRTGHCSWNFYMLMKWSPHFAENLRDHYLGNEFLEKNSWSLYW